MSNTADKSKRFPGLTVADELRQEGREAAWEDLMVAFPKEERRKIANDLAHGWVVTGVTTRRPRFYKNGIDGPSIRRVMPIKDDWAPLQPMLPFDDVNHRTYVGESLPTPEPHHIRL